MSELRNKNWLINKEVLEFYVDPDQSSVAPELFAQRLYLYRYENGAHLLDYTTDNTISNTALNANKYVFGGVLEYDENNRPNKYSFDITNHISNIIRNDSLNIDLGLVVTSNIDDISTLDAVSANLEEANLKYPRADTLNHLGTVLIGSNPASNDLSAKKVKLELIYSSY